MNTLVKRSMMLGLFLVFIGTSVVPACAQRGITKGIKTALGKKPPLTGPAPVVKPVTPCVPVIVTGAQVPNAKLNAAVESKVTVRALTEQMISSLDFGKQDLRTNGFIKTAPLLKAAIDRKISFEKLIDYEIMTHPTSTRAKRLLALKDANLSLICNTPIREEEIYLWLQESKSWPYYVKNGQALEDVITAKTDFSKLITEDTPKFIPVYFKVNALIEMVHIERVLYPGPINTGLIYNAGRIAKIDNFLFIENNGQLFINGDALRKVRSYEEILFKQQINGIGGHVNDTEVAIIERRNQQITDALIHNQSKGVNSLEEVKTQVEMPAQFSTQRMKADVTTQRTAEEIKMLVENLDSNDPLRLVIERALRSAARHGHIK